MIEPVFATIEEYARLRGYKDPSFLHRLRRQKDPRLVMDGERVVVAASNKAFEEMTDHSKVREKRLKEAPPPGAGNTQTAAGQGAGGKGATSEPVDLDSFAFVARLEKRERYRQLRLQNEELAGNLVRRDVVQRAVFQVARDAQEGLVSIVDRIGSQIAIACQGLDVSRVYSLIETEHRRLAEQLVARARALLAKESPAARAEQRVAP